MVRLSELDDNQKKDLEFTEHQLGVIDVKANNVLMVDSVLIVISSLGLIFNPDAIIEIKGLMVGATIFVLASVGLCLRTIWTSWATDLAKLELTPGQKTIEDVRFTGYLQKIVDLRNIKTKFLHTSLVVLAISLGLFVMTFVLDFAVTQNPSLLQS